MKNSFKITILCFAVLIIALSIWPVRTLHLKPHAKSSEASNTKIVAESTLTPNDSDQLAHSNEASAQLTSANTVSSTINNKQLAKLIDQHIDPEMRREINEKLRPGGKPPTIIKQGKTLILDTSDRASTVMVGFIDEDAGLIITDFTQPLPVDEFQSQK